MTKQAERQSARQMRSDGKSITEISRNLGVSKSSVSHWVADLPYPTFSLSDKTTTRLRERARRNQTEAFKRRKGQEDLGFVEASNTTDRRLWAFAALYWGEGVKNKNKVGMGSSDPKMLAFFVSFILNYLKAPVESITLRIQIHPGLDVKAAEKFWQQELGLPTTALRKTHVCVPISSKQVTEHRCPYGTAMVLWCNTDARARISGWIDALCR